MNKDSRTSDLNLRLLNLGFYFQYTVQPKENLSLEINEKPVGVTRNNTFLRVLCLVFQHFMENKN